MKQAEAKETLARLQEPTVQPIQDNEFRERCLARARLDNGAQRYGRDPSGEPMLLPGGQIAVVKRNRDGLISEMKAGAAVLQETTVRPHEWDAHDRAWQARRRRGENEELAKWAGKDWCIEQGLFSAEEAREMDPERSRHVQLPRGLEGL